MSKFCVLNCDDAKAWAPISFGDMFENCLCESCDCSVWNVAAEKCLPPNINEFDVVIISGSRHNCRDRETLPWFEPLCEYVRGAARSGIPRIYGGCFGCQLIGLALGGEVDYNPGKVFTLKAESIRVNDEFHSLVSTSNIATGNSNSQDSTDQSAISIDTKISFNIIESHGDCVVKLPPDALRLGESDSCENEIFVAGSKRNILACQGHPEFELQYSVHDRIWPAVQHLYALRWLRCGAAAQDNLGFPETAKVLLRVMLLYFN